VRCKQTLVVILHIHSRSNVTRRGLESSSCTYAPRQLCSFATHLDRSCTLATLRGLAFSRRNAQLSSCCCAGCAIAGTCTTALLVVYLVTFERSNAEPWTTPRKLAAYALGISLLVLFNGVTALLWRFACCGRRTSLADVHGAALLPVHGATCSSSSLKVVEVPGLAQGKPAEFGCVVAKFAGGAAVEGSDAACIVIAEAPAAAIPPRPMH
jgi:hypothetical protein